MAKYINISKHLEKDNKHYYFVSGDYGPTFYILLEPEKKLIWFYKNQNFSEEPLGVMDFNQERPFKSIPGLHDIDVAMAAMRAKLAIYKNDFPNYIGVQC